MSLIARHGEAALRRRSVYLHKAAAGGLGTLIACAGSVLAYWLHFNLAAAVSLQLLLVVLASLRGSVVLATAVSIAGFFCLNFFFVPPFFQLGVADAHNWVSLFAFELAALLVTRLATRARKHAAEADLQRDRTVKLYELSRAILLIDGTRPVATQLTSLIREVIQVEQVDLWLLYDDVPNPPQTRTMTDPESAAATYQRGRSEDDPDLHFSRRLLQLGTTVIGAISLKGWCTDALMADGIASLTAVAVERARAVQKETRAASERDTETLRTAVLDGLAHGFKTPLTAIQTASSGLLAIDNLNPTQAELVTIIDEQASMLNKMATRLLQTAALERKDLRLRKVDVPLPALMRQVIAEQDEPARNRIELQADPGLRSIQADAQLVEQAFLQLLDNALKYADPGTTIHVAATQTDAYTCVMVENNGPAIRLAERERIFERFYRGSAETLHRQPGTGLGLSVVSKTAAAHRGRAWVECDNGLNRFFFTLEGKR